MKRVLGAQVVHRDTGLIAGEVDAHIVYLNGEAALELTIVGDRSTLEVESALLLKDLSVSELTWWWDVRYGPGIPNIRMLQLHVSVLLRDQSARCDLCLARGQRRSRR